MCADFLLLYCMVSLDLIKLSTTAKRSKLISKVLPQVAEYLKSFSDIKAQKKSTDLLKLVCCAVEVLCAGKKRLHVDKKRLVFEIYDVVFIEDPLTPLEKEELSERIEFLHAEGLIKGVSTLRWVKKQALGLVFKKD